MSDNLPTDSYKSISNPSKGIYRESGSKFLAFAYPVTEEDEIKEIIQNLKKDFFDARHHCYAYRLGKDGELWRANDDGEPSSTAGRPILGQLLSNELSDILIVVVRYFGGVKLGVPGLIRAYKTATADAISNSDIITKYAKKSYSIEFPYLQMNGVMKALRDCGADITEQSYDNMCRFTFDVRLSEAQKAQKSLLDIEELTFLQTT